MVFKASNGKSKAVVELLPGINCPKRSVKLTTTTGNTCWHSCFLLDTYFSKAHEKNLFKEIDFHLCHGEHDIVLQHSCIAISYIVEALNNGWCANPSLAIFHIQQMCVKLWMVLCDTNEWEVEGHRLASDECVCMYLVEYIAECLAHMY